MANRGKTTARLAVELKGAPTEVQATLDLIVDGIRQAAGQKGVDVNYPEPVRIMQVARVCKPAPAKPKAVV